MNPGPLAPEARMIPLDHQASRYILLKIILYSDILTLLGEGDYKVERFILSPLRADFFQSIVVIAIIEAYRTNIAKVVLGISRTL